MKGKAQLFLAICVILLYITARKARRLTDGEESPYKTREEKFRSFNCFDMRVGTLSCFVKVYLKHYYFNRYDMFHQHSEDHLPPLLEAFNMGPIVSSGLDYFETLYVGLTHKEQISVGTGSFVGAYIGGLAGKEWFSNEYSSSLQKSGFLCGSIVGSWLGGQLGLMVYDIGHGFDSLRHHYYPKHNVTAGGPTDNITPGSSALP